jgi:hypothetical protein
MAIFAITSLRDAGLLLAAMCAVYLFFLLFGVGLSSLVTFNSCSKTDTTVHFRQSAFWALYPTIAYIVVRSLEILRVQFDKFYRGIDTSEGGIQRAGWISVGYVMMISSLAGLYAMMDYSIEGVCIPTIDEATAFRQDMLAAQAKKAAAQEATPAVQLSTPPSTTP